MFQILPISNPELIPMQAQTAMPSSANPWHLQTGRAHNGRLRQQVQVRINMVDLASEKVCQNLACFKGT